MWDSTYFGIKTICDSKNEIEIRLYSFFSRDLAKNLIILSFNNNKWSLAKYSYNRAVTGGYELGNISLKPDPDIPQIHEDILLNIFDSLKQNKIFLLPSQNELKYEPIRHAGFNTCRVIFKAGNKFRYYSFASPTLYKINNPTIKEFENYENIFRILTRLFNKI